MLALACGPVTIVKVASSDDSSGTPDTQNPVTLLISGPGSYVNDLSARFEFAANESVQRFEARTFAVGTAPGPWVNVTSPLTLQVAGDGSYDFEVRAVDLAGNTGDAIPTYEWSVDTGPPIPPQSLSVTPLQTTILSLSWSSASDDFSGVEGYRIYYVTDPGTPNANEGASGFSVGLLNSVLMTGLAPCQVYDVTITAVDRAGNESPTGVARAQHNWCGWNGTFAEALYPVGLDPRSLAVSDFDADGVQDLAVLQQGTKDVAVLLGRRNGALSADPLSPYPAGSAPIALVAADFYRDGAADLLTLGNQQLWLLNGSSCGSFGAAFLAGTAPGACFATGEWTGPTNFDEVPADGRPDLVVGKSYSVNYTGCNNCGLCVDPPPTGHVFKSICSINNTITGTIIACVAGDFDGDGSTDSGMLSDNGYLYVHRYGDQDASGSCGGSETNCNGCCGPILSSYAGAGSNCVVSADFNGDGDPDLALGNSLSNSIAILLGNGTGAFSAPQPYSVGAHTSALAVADINGDGRADLAAATEDGFALLLSPDTTGPVAGLFSDPLHVALGYAAQSIVAGDFDADGIIDLALSVPALNTVSILSGAGGTQRGNGTFDPRQVLLARQAIRVLHADFDHDGIQDLATGSPDGLTDIYLGNGSAGHADGTFRSGESHIFPQQDPGLYEQFDWASGDFNGDHEVDLVVSAYYGPSQTKNRGDYALLLGQPAAPGHFVPGPSGSVWLTTLLAADFGNDGISDLAGYDPDTGNLVVRYGSALNPLVGAGISINAGLGQFGALAARDCDGDGRADLVIGDGTQLRVALKNAVGTGFALQPLTSAGTGIDISSIVASDFNADGIVDLAVCGHSSLRVLLGQGSGCAWNHTFAAPMGLFAPELFDRLHAGDFDGDGIIDLVATQSSAVLFLRGMGDGGFETPVAIQAGAYGDIAAGDFDTDGALDVVLTDGSVPSLGLLLGEGGSH